MFFLIPFLFVDLKFERFSCLPCIEQNSQSGGEHNKLIWLNVELVNVEDVLLVEVQKRCVTVYLSWGSTACMTYRFTASHAVYMHTRDLPLQHQLCLSVCLSKPRGPSRPPSEMDSIGKSLPLAHISTEKGL